MKQHITIQQFNETSEKGKRVIRKWWYSKGYQYNDFDADGNEIEDPLMSIGQMIEFLGEDWVDYVFVAMKDGSILFNFQGELCDALYEVVKKVAESDIK